MRSFLIRLGQVDSRDLVLVFVILNLALTAAQIWGAK